MPTSLHKHITGPNPSPSYACSPRKLRQPMYSTHKHLLSPRKLDLSSRKQMTENETDYSRYKGKGRYRTSLPGCAPYYPFLLRIVPCILMFFSDSDATVASPTPRTSLFQAGSGTNASNAPSNALAPFAYEDVERNRDVRKKMHAEDCFCCRDVRAFSVPPSLPGYHSILLTLCIAHS